MLSVIFDMVMFVVGKHPVECGCIFFLEVRHSSEDSLYPHLLVRSHLHLCLYLGSVRVSRFSSLCEGQLHFSLACGVKCLQQHFSFNSPTEQKQQQQLPTSSNIHTHTHTGARTTLCVCLVGLCICESASTSIFVSAGSLWLSVTSQKSV